MEKEKIKSITIKDNEKWRQEHGYKIYSKTGSYEKLNQAQKGKNMILK